MREIISIVVPCYEEEEVLECFYNRMIKVLEDLDRYYRINSELIFIDDGSKDKTFELIKSFYHDKIKMAYISFSRNFGKEAAMIAGLKKSTGEYVAVIDADLQDPPELLIKMVDRVLHGKCDCVAARRVSRKGEPFLKTIFSKVFYKLINVLSNTEIVDGARDFRLMTRKMVEAVIEVKEYNRFSKGIFSWIGFETQWVDYENCERVAGKSKWSLKKLFKYSVDGIISYSTVPLALASLIGLLFCLIAFIMICVIIVKTLIWGDPVAGYPSMICVIFLIGGIQLFCMGILGQYLSKIYMEVKNRPLYIIKEES